MAISKEDLKDFHREASNRRQTGLAKENLVEFKKTWKLSEYKEDPVALFSVIFFSTLLILIFYFGIRFILTDEAYETAIEAYGNEDYVNAVKFFEISCNKKNGKSCNYLGVMYDSGEQIQEDIPKAIELYSKACRLKNNDGCNNLTRIAQQPY